MTGAVNTLRALCEAQGAILTMDAANMRPALEGAVEALIGLLDRIDGDSDMENYDPDEEDDDPDFCTAGDDGCGIFVLMGETYWGSQWDEQGKVPDYGDDQRVIVTSRAFRSGYHVDLQKSVRLD